MSLYMPVGEKVWFQFLECFVSSLKWSWVNSSSQVTQASKHPTKMCLPSQAMKMLKVTMNARRQVRGTWHKVPIQKVYFGWFSGVFFRNNSIATSSFRNELHVYSLLHIQGKQISIWARPGVSQMLRRMRYFFVLFLSVLLKTLNPRS